ncbi:MAG: serine/threonine protein kinase, partial [ANME-2 cluster archaeon]
MIGKTILHYKILEKLGEGGMGVVYKAEDIKLERIVALKFLPPHMLANKEAEQRFISEAKAASSLEHNNICAIHEISETEDGQLFIAMSYLEGKTLREKIDTSPLKVDEAISIAIQTAEGLKLAHEKGIVHRDIKPANIMITTDGTAKIMDFGLAKLGGKTKLTQMGTTLGTFAYMSPEQSKGEEVDKRADIWSLGVVLYEMLTGQLPFKGDYEQAVIYSIINESPEPVTAVRTGVPMELERITNKLLAKNINERYQSMTDALVDLQTLRNKSTTSDVSSITKNIIQRKRKLPLKWI